MKYLKRLYQPVNIIGLLFFPFWFMAAGMSTDATGSKNLHWAHKLFILGNVAIGPLCLVGALARKYRYLGLVGVAFAAFVWATFIGVCGDEFSCGQ